MWDLDDTSSTNITTTTSDSELPMDHVIKIRMLNNRLMLMTVAASEGHAIPFYDLMTSEVDGESQNVLHSQDMSLSCFFNPLHGCLLHADGHGEVWTDWNSTSKFFQYGWRCTTNEDMYANKTLLGNWNEERYDIQKRKQLQPLPSQFTHYFESTYASDYSKEKPRRLRRVTRQPHWFPGHQPELEPPPIKPTARSCYMIDYEPPHGRAACSLAEGKPKEAAETAVVPLKQ